ncbi:MAG: tripartite tricarboxylate transporter substrate binding protein [Rubrivivax sp.]
MTPSRSPLPGRRIGRRPLLALGAWMLAPHARAAWPERPVRMVVPFPPGGGTDALARILAPELARRWGQQVVVDNRAGAQGNIGTAAVAKAAPDGYTLLMAHQGVFTVNPHLYDKMGVDPLKDFVPVARVTDQPFVLSVHPDFPARSLKELVDAARAQPGRITYASTASGPQMAGELFQIASGTQLLHVAYKGAGPAVIDAVAGHVNAIMASPPGVAPHVRSGKLRGLAVFGKTRIAAMPDVPTALEQGYPALAESTEWYGFAVPAGTPAALVKGLAADFAAVLAQPEMQAALRAVGLNPSFAGEDEFARQIAYDHEQWRRVVKTSGAKAE